jgi:hypothetical protein
MNIGFTGTRQGMSPRQIAELRTYLCAWKTGTFHHGAAVGADTEAAAIAVELGYDVVAYPAVRGHELERNHTIVAACDRLLAAPYQDVEIIRSGTWATVRYGRKAHKTVIILKRWL